MASIPCARLGASDGSLEAVTSRGAVDACAASAGAATAMAAATACHSTPLNGEGRFGMDRDPLGLPCLREDQAGTNRKGENGSRMVKISVARGFRDQYSFRWNRCFE